MRRWQELGTLCRDIRCEIARQVERIYPTFLVCREQTVVAATMRRLLEVNVSTNLKNHLSQGALIEVAPALEALLTNSDVDLSLPMRIVAPPHRAQYLRFGEVAMRYLTVPDPSVTDCMFDGVFCFFIPTTAGCAEGETCWELELIFITKR
jgi:hypothetical protein